MKKKNKTKWNKFVIKFAKAIANFIVAMLCVSCGVTKATISKPAEGTQTTITITTNNPITTTTPITTNLNQK